MAGSVLTEQYVDIVTRNLRETMDALRAIQKQADATGEALKRMKGQASSGTGAAAGVVSPKGAAPGGVGAMIGAAAGPIGIATAAVATSGSRIALQRTCRGGLQQGNGGPAGTGRTARNG